MPRRLAVIAESWPIAGRFVISRGSKTRADLVIVTLEQAGATGRGECVPYGRYGESSESVMEQVEALRSAVEGGLSRNELQQAMAPGAARNALDCALWDLEAKQAGLPVHALAGVEPAAPATTAFTISIAEPEKMAAAAANSGKPVLKLKLGREGDPDRLAAVRAAVPDAVLIADANEGWTAESLARNFEAARAAKVALIEQPLPAGNDEALREIARSVPVCADESFHDRTSFDALAGKYDAVNIKLDKTGGLTEAFAALAEAQSRGLGVMIGCMVSTSLSMAPAMLLATRAQFVDLDGPLLLERDREDGLRYDGARVFPAARSFWG
jgi:L-alanine-DL-glutamate epimerase-like enolase superfamily enzyme